MLVDVLDIKYFYVESQLIIIPRNNPNPDKIEKMVLKIELLLIYKNKTSFCIMYLIKNKEKLLKRSHFRWIS